MVRVLLILSVVILIYFIVYPTFKDGFVYYGSGDAKKEGRKSFSFGSMWKLIISKFKRNKNANNT